MFRDTTPSQMSATQLGVGSVIRGGHGVDWLLVGYPSKIALLNLTTMMITRHVDVQDVNFVSTSEAREICDLTGYNWTFSDFDFDVKGLKKV